MNTTYKFDVALKRILLEGTLAWEYNPLRNYRLDEDMIFYKDKFYTILDFVKDHPPKGVTNVKDATITDEGYIYIEYGEEDENFTVYEWDLLSNIDKTVELPIPYQKGSLVDFIVDENDLQFDLNHPVLITPTYSYDNSVDLIINDGKTPPKIINTRFSAIGKNKYKIIDRNGNNDTNIYDRGSQFGIDTSLYKITTLVPRVTFGGESYGGNLKIGNYHFYFKYSDLDGNESDFVALSGLVSVFLGNTPNSINSGFRDQNSNKKVRFIFSNVSEAYDYIIVYYSRASSEEFLNRAVEYAKILQKYKISRYNNTVIDITGFENIEEVSLADINLRLLIYDSAKTQAISLNMLFLGNTTQSNENHDELSKLALYIIPSIDISQRCNIDLLSDFYKGDISNTYYDSKFIYNYTGYWDDEIYRFGVVFIRNNNTLTPVYSTRGLYLSSNSTNYDDKGEYNKNKVISYDETTFNIDSLFIVSTDFPELENAKGVCYIPRQDSLTNIIGIDFKCSDTVIKALKDIGIKGFFIVRLKRIPTTLCQAYTIGLEPESYLPLLPMQDSSYVYESFLDLSESTYNYWDDDGRTKQGKGYLLSNEFRNHKRMIVLGSIYPGAAICPDYDVNTPYLNSLFTGSNFTVVTQYSNKRLLPTSNERLFVSSEVTLDTTPKYHDVKIIGVEDNVKLAGIDEHLFAARAGEAEEAFRFSHIGREIKKDHGGNNLVRGSFGPYLGITDYDSYGDLITIKIPGYNLGNLLDYFKIRYFDASMFYPISDRITFDKLKLNSKSLGTFYRGDCYICKFTHRLNRNFRDATTPTNDAIVDSACWTHNINYEDEVLKKDDLDKINLGDVNAVNLGMWVSFILRSNINHSVRGLNESNVDEAELIGNARGFYPYYPISARAAYKLPETGTYNKGFEASVGELVFEELPVTPYYKNTFATRIAYSNIQITSAFKNAYRVFPAQNYRDYPITYGEITKIIEWNGDLICVLEHGIYQIPINERAVSGQGSGGYVYINTSNVLPENPSVISDTYGSLWIDSIIKTPSGIYGVDTVAKKIWKVDKSGIELISDFKVQEFLNHNITLTERELTPIIGIRNVKTHYNAFKHDVMFTFYDDLHGVDEVAWNLCWNEAMNKWITFYSWIPSFSENIHNSYFSFDRETSKNIALLALNEKSEQHNLIYLSNTLFSSNSNEIGTLNYDLKVEGAKVYFKWEILKDPYKNKEKFSTSINHDETNNPMLCYTKDYPSYVVDINDYNTVEYENKIYKLIEGKWKKSDNTEVANLVVEQILFLKRLLLWKQAFEEQGDKLKVYLLNIRVTPTIVYNGNNATYAEYIANLNANSLLTGGYIDRTIAVIPKEHLEALSTDFWKHGQAGIIDIKEEIKPTNWYGKLHPFEFEFIVRDAPDTHKIFDNLIIISNKAEPESFHYEIVGECYEFAKDKKNIYIRLEATKEFFLNEGYNVAFNDNYKSLAENHRLIKKDPIIFDKSTIFPTYYYRLDRINTVEDYYHGRTEESGKNFAYLSGSEIVYYKDLNEFRIWTHSKGVDVAGEGGILKGNMNYKEDKWYVLIPSINLVLKNEPFWSNVNFGTGSPDKIPIELQLYCFTNIEQCMADNPVLKERGLVLWEDNSTRYLEAKIKDKYIKIRIRYSGEDLAVISAIKTLYSISYA